MRICDKGKLLITIPDPPKNRPKCVYCDAPNAAYICIKDGELGFACMDCNYKFTNPFIAGEDCTLFDEVAKFKEKHP